MDALINDLTNELNQICAKALASKNLLPKITIKAQENLIKLEIKNLETPWAIECQADGLHSYLEETNRIVSRTPQLRADTINQALDALWFHVVHLVNYARRHANSI